MSELLKEWEKYALEGVALSFDAEGSIKKDLSLQHRRSSIDILYKVIDTMNPDLAWPFIKLADLLSDDLEKFKLHLRAYKIEKNIYSAMYIADSIVLRSL